MNTTNKSEQIWESLRDPEFRKQFIDEHVDVGIAFQIRSLRNRQGLKQSDLAKLLDVEQSQVSPWENPDYGRYTSATLKNLAKAFDVGLLVRFVPFSTLVDWTVNLTSEVIAPPSFSEEEKKYHVTALASIVAASKAIRNTKDVDVYDWKDWSRPVPDIASTAKPAEVLEYA